MGGRPQTLLDVALFNASLLDEEKEKDHEVTEGHNLIHATYSKHQLCLL
jgi:hypothetical protein